MISSDRGLCGAQRQPVPPGPAEAARLERAGPGIQLGTIGQKGTAFFASAGADIVAQATKLGDHPHLEHIIGVIKVMLDDYQEGKIDQLHLLYNEFVNTMVQRPTLVQLLPIHAEAIGGSVRGFGIICMNRTPKRCWINC